ncbi:hypothetical protein SAMN03159434_11611 [Enterobacter sp. NFR05]|nr:hypothetical protein SAMN03159434_11611 [Enterobacter sp. NFR05]
MSPSLFPGQPIVCVALTPHINIHKTYINADKTLKHANQAGLLSRFNSHTLLVNPANDSLRAHKFHAAICSQSFTPTITV